jgi:vanillate O-demethylase monooxygenase subunit
MYMRNGWYALAWSEEVTGELHKRAVMGRDLLFYRAEDGQPVAMDNTCPHRFAPLHYGQRVGNSVRCAYHGLEFDRTGMCVLNPHGEGFIPPAARLRAYPLRECHGLVWIWMGQPELAAATELPPGLDFLHVKSGLTRAKGYLLVKADYRLIADNLMDQAHVPILHARSIGTDTTKVPIELTREPRRVKVAQSTYGVRPAPFARQLLPGVDLVDRWGDMQWDAPSLFHVDSGSTPAGAGREHGARMFTAHLLTPASVDSTHYFFISCRTFQLDDAATTEAIRSNVEQVFVREDQWMLEAIQQTMGSADFFDARPALIQTDAGVVATRRALQRLIELEQQAADTPASHPLPLPKETP